MKAMILAAGLGTRLKPWTDHHPKALVPVNGVPMLQRVIEMLQQQGFNRLIINVHHFADQIVDFIKSNHWSADIEISDETGKLLETGGGILHARNLLLQDSKPFLVYNADILSNADCRELMNYHDKTDTLATLLVSDRNSSRKLSFTEQMDLCGWSNQKTGEIKGDFIEKKQLAFSGIHVLSTSALELMGSQHEDGDKFGIMDFYLANMSSYKIKGYEKPDLQILDIGKPDTLAKANSIIA